MTNPSAPGQVLADEADAMEPAPDRSFSLRKLEAIEADIAGVERAIELIDANTYGRCETCGTAIRAEVMREDPLTVRCDAHVVRARPALFAEEPHTTVADAEHPDAVAPEIVALDGPDTDAAEAIGDTGGQF